MHFSVRNETGSDCKREELCDRLTGDFDERDLAVS